MILTTAVRPPRTDENVMQLDAKLNGNGMQYSALYDPSGVERDRAVWILVYPSSRRSPCGLHAEWRREVCRPSGSNAFLRSHPSVTSARPPMPRFTGLTVRSSFCSASFVTAVFLPLVLIGFIVTAMRRQWRELMVVLVVPLYFATVQPLVHTEYRYVLATSHMLMIAAAVADVLAIREDRCSRAQATARARPVRRESTIRNVARVVAASSSSEIRAVPPSLTSLQKAATSPRGLYPDGRAS